MHEIITIIKSDVNPDRIVTFIKEKCQQEGLDFEVKMEGKMGKETIHRERELLSKPILIGNKFAIKALTVRNRHFGTLNGVTVPGRIMIDIDPGANSFGIGTHQTTQMCVEAIEKYVNDNMSVLDIGCGGGILSIVSLLLGADHATGVDISRSAVDASINNVKLNNVSDRFTAICGNLTDSVTGQYDLIVANILADPIKELLKSLREYAHDDTTVILSGIVDFRENEVLEAAKDFKLIERHDRDGWVCLVMKPRR